MRPRPITPGDSVAVAGLIRAAFAPLRVDPPPSAMQVTAGAIERHLEAGGGLIIDAARACLLWTEDTGGLYLSRLAVHPSQRGLGLARLLLAAAEREGRRRALPRLWLSTRLALTDNRRLFARHGFTEVARHAHPRWDRPTYVEMELWLHGMGPDKGSATRHGHMAERSENKNECGGIL